MSASQTRQQQFLKGKLTNCLSWISTWNDRWKIPEDTKPEFLAKLETRVEELSRDKERLHTYTNELFLENVASQGWIRQFLLMMHKFYKRGVLS